MNIANLFPYQIKDREAFYDRNHDAVQLLDRKPYWNKRLKKSIEGWWVNDGGTWVHMIPKLDWHINVFVTEVVINKNRNRKVSNLELTDREFIFFYYLLCCYGFSGYSEDEFFTSNLVVDLIERGESLDKVMRDKLDENPEIYDAHGKMKKYVRAWDYLTKKYLVEEPQGKPLGKILYGNEMMDGLVFGARNSAKTTMVGSHVTHEFYTGGILDWADAKDMANMEVKFGIGSVDSSKVQGFAKVIHDFHKNMPGKYNRNGVVLPSPLYRRMVGTWGEGEVVHKYIEKFTKEEKGGSILDFGIYTSGNLKRFVGGRKGGGQIREEIGLLEALPAVMNAEEEGLRNKTDGVKLAIALNLGTSGFLKYVKGAKDVFYNPGQYGIYGIPNYWEKESSMIGLFLADYYVDKNYKDKQGNTILQDAYNASVKQVTDLIEAHASPQRIRDKELNNPNWPSQMFLDSQTSVLCSDLARMRRIQVQEKGAYRIIGDLKRDEKGKVYFEENPKGMVIDSYNPKTTQQPKDNSWVIYEQPIKGAQKGLYRIGYDPIRSDGLGKTDDASLVSIIVKKGFDLSGRGKQNTIVARWTGRLKSLDKNHELPIMAAEYYNATVLHEEDVGGFATYCRTHKKFGYLAPTPFLGSSMKVSGNALFNVGIKIGDNADLKPYLLEAYNDYLETEIGYDEENENAPIRNIDSYDDLLLLDEIAQFGEGNFDNISTMLVLTAWDRSEEQRTYGSGDKGEKKVNNNAREMWQMAMSNLGYTDEYRSKFN